MSQISYNDLGEVTNLGLLTKTKRAPVPHVYVIGFADPSQNFRKVGSTCNLRSRVQQLSVATPYAVSFEYALKSPDSLTNVCIEKYVHEALAKYHIRGEWFDVGLAIAIDAIRDASEITLRVTTPYFDLDGR